MSFHFLVQHLGLLQPQIAGAPGTATGPMDILTNALKLAFRLNGFHLKIIPLHIYKNIPKGILYFIHKTVSVGSVFSFVGNKWRDRRIFQS